MKITIISPNFSSDVSVVDIGMTYLATYINERTEHEANILDFTYHRRDWKEHLRRNMEAFGPDMIGISTVSMFMQYTKTIAREIKDRYGLPVILGGYHPTLCPDDSIAGDDVDAICVGDGEFTLTEYMDAVEAGKSPEGIRGLWYKEDGKVRKNPLRELIQDIDALPIPNYDLWEDLDKFMFYNGVIYFIGTRGCPFPCTYCSEFPMRDAVPGKHFRVRDPRAYAREMKQQWEKYGDRGMKVAHTFDPVFSINTDWVRDFSDEYIKIGLSKVLPFSCFTRADTIDEERIKMLSAANLKIARIGIEAGNEHIRREIYEKDIPTEQYRKVFGLLHKHGVAVTGYNILGGPGETMDTMQETFDLVRELEVDRPIFFTYRPLPKTKGREKVTELGGKLDEENWDKIDSLHQRSNVYTGKLTPKQIVRFRRKCLFYFMSRRTLKLIKEQKLAFFANFVKYLLKGVRDGVHPQYVVGYFFVSGGKNVIS
ncbi:MAG: B12-binding domain-containing radical SAM protein [Thermodesulfobacteriota bacterium]